MQLLHVQFFVGSKCGLGLSWKQRSCLLISHCDCRYSHRFQKITLEETVVAKSLDTVTNVVLAEVLSRQPCQLSLQKTSPLFLPSTLGLNEENSLAMGLRWGRSGWQLLFGARRVLPRLSLEACAGQPVVYDPATRLCHHIWFSQHVRGHIHTSRAHQSCTQVE